MVLAAACRCLRPSAQTSLSASPMTSFCLVKAAAPAWITLMMHAGDWQRQLLQLFQQAAHSTRFLSLHQFSVRDRWFVRMTLPMWTCPIWVSSLILEQSCHHVRKASGSVRSLTWFTCLKGPVFSHLTSIVRPGNTSLESILSL